MREKLVIAFVALAPPFFWPTTSINIFLVLPDEAAQGYIYRIIYFHVPAAMVAMLGFFAALV